MWVLFLPLLLNACSKQEDFVPSQEASTTAKSYVTVQQNIVVDGVKHTVTVKANPDSDEIEFLDAPASVDSFFIQYENTFVPHVILSDKGTTVCYFKDMESFSNAVTFQSTELTESTRTLEGGLVENWQHAGPAGWHLDIAPITWWSSYTPNYSPQSSPISCYGQQIRWVGSTYNDHISLLRFWHYYRGEPLSYCGYWDANLSGRQIYISKTSNLISYDFPLWTIRATRFKSWNDKISSMILFQSHITFASGYAFII